jgi:hypothetical protein
MSPPAAAFRVLPESWQKGEYRIVPVISAICCVVSVFMTLLNGSSLADNLVNSHAIGFSQLALATLVRLFFHGRLPVLGVRADLERERRRAAEALQGETAARLALLQAQIEPHFLFNTLANIDALIKQDPDAASRTLEELNSYLRASLRRSRQMTAPVGEEVELVRALLALAGARLGARLAYTIAVPPELRAAPLPPLLLQPLVENANAPRGVIAKLVVP